MTVATDATPVVTSDMVAPAAQNVVSRQQLARSTGSQLVPFFCGPSFRANLIWYCRQGASACTAIAYFLLTAPIPTYAGGCSIVLNAPCQIYTWASPGNGSINTVTGISITQTGLSGAPVVGDKVLVPLTGSEAGTRR